ncbi:hypothetical protein VT930_11850 [Mycobacterium sherrisii]|uniref:hypothetical protein n=1 Tax=Mycobacterium sherrisii TaxID=243061 RepID=UPI002DDCBD0B|nr:hypothetical protein [Mycobacterium sherrisii]MEC4763797.1 hypothetical protein [Mycobacterium sherrisii]
MVEETRVCVVCGNTFTFVVPRGMRPVTCSAECKKKRKYQTNLRWRETTRVPDHVHGTVAGYVNYLCRCDKCKDAWAEYQVEYQRGRKTD